MESDKCKCGNKRAPSARYCLTCKAAYMREWRKSHPLTKEAKKKSSCRSLSRYYLKVGRLTQKDCEKCGAEEVERHHDDYDDPLNVRFMCRPCHLAFHAEQFSH
jgi:hypothetical protein